jgi:hypothetical protein
MQQWSSEVFGTGGAALILGMVIMAVDGLARGILDLARGTDSFALGC